MALVDKFNVIQEFTCHDLDYMSLVNNYIENYLESDINIIHPELIYQLVWNNLITDIDDVLNSKLKNYILNIKKTIKSLIKNEKFDLDNGLNTLINNYYNKTNYLKTIFKTSNYNCENLFHDMILSDQTLICYLQNELNTLNKSNKNIIKKLLNNIIKITSEDNYKWFLKLIGTSLRDNIPHIPLIIDNYNFIDFILLINYTHEIYYYYNSFINDNDCKVIINSFVNIIFDKLLLLLSTTNYYNLINLLTTKWYIITQINNNNEMIIPIKKELSLQISKSIKKINTISNNNLYDLLKLIIIASKFGLIETYIFSIFNNECFLEKLIEIIDTNINTDPQFVCDLIIHLKNIKEKDIFINNYHNKLITRLLSLTTDLINESLIVKHMNIHFDNKYTKKLSKCIYDIQTSNEINSSFDSFDGSKLSMVTISYSNWNINWNNGYIDGDIIDANKTSSIPSICTIFDWYNRYYLYSYENKRKLLWLPQYGEITIDYNNNEIILFPIQLMVLELFNEKNDITIDVIKNSNFFKNYSESYKINIIKSLIVAGILNNNFNTLTLSDTIIKNNFIDVYYYVLDNKEDETSNREMINDDLCLSRKNIVSCVINHHIKIHSLDYETLYNLVKNDIKLFSLNNELFTETIKWMMENDYILEKESKYLKLLF
jgi:hypothetical protein